MYLKCELLFGDSVNIAWQAVVIIKYYTSAAPFQNIVIINDSNYQLFVVEAAVA